MIYLIERNIYVIITIILSIVIDIVVFKVIEKRHIKSKLCTIIEILLIICSCFFIINGIRLMNHYVYVDVGPADIYIDPYPNTEEGVHNLEIAGIINIVKALFISICAFINKKITNGTNGDGAEWHRVDKK